jgi:hypothetical protein
MFEEVYAKTTQTQAEDFSSQGETTLRTNIYSEKKFAIKRGSPLFISITNKDIFDTMLYSFEWNMWDIDDKLILKSNANFITYLFGLEGNYTIDLTITNKKTKQKKYLKKLNWIQVTV